MRTDYLRPELFGLILTAMMPENRLAIEVSEATGLRIGDVLALRRADVEKGQRFTVKEQKTGKSRRIYIPQGLWMRLLQGAGRVWCFEGRTSPKKHRTRQAVFKDIKRVAKLYRVDGRRIRENVAPHSARKIYSVLAYKRTGSLARVQQLLNHSSEAVTVLYALADEISAKK